MLLRLLLLRLPCVPAASLFDANVQQRMREEYDVMTACAASPHILDAFCMGTLWLAGSWRPCILMEVGGGLLVMTILLETRCLNL